MADKALTDLPDGGAATSGDVIYVVRSGNSRKAGFPDLSGFATTAQLAGKLDVPEGTTSQYIRGDGSLATFPSIPSGTVTSVGVSVPTGLSVSNSPVTSSGTIAITYASGYQGYTTAEANKLAGIAAGAQVNLPFGTTAGTVTQGNDSRLSDSREWTASTVGQAEAEAGTATTRRAWTAQRVAQAIAALAVSASRQIIAGVGLTGGGTLAADRTLNIDKATNAQVAAGTSNKALTADLIPSASAWSSVGSNTVAIDWGSALTFERVASGNITVSNPTNGQPGTVRYLRLLGNNSTQRSISFGNQFSGDLPDRSVNNAERVILVIVCETATSFTVSAIAAGDVP